MNHRSTLDAVRDLQQNGRLIVHEREVDPDLEIAEIQRRVYRSGGPAVLFTRVRGCRFSVVSNLFGSLEQARFLFRHQLENVRRAIELKIDPGQFFQRPMRYWKAPWTAMRMRPRKVGRGPVLRCEITKEDLPRIRSWPDDGGPFITLPQVYTEDPLKPSVMNSNLGMYRVQLSGNAYAENEVGLHYQIHRGIGVHHQRALEIGKPLRVNITVGGAPSMTLAAVMPLPEGMSELTFAGALGGRRIPMIRQAGGPAIYADADFCIQGTLLPDLKPEGPFGDHLGYYSLRHAFPVLRIDRVLHREDAIWPFTVVGRPPQEDTTFGDLIHELTEPVIPTVIPGVHEVNAVDASGVHPLLLAIGSERYVPYEENSRPQELLTQANAILGQGQMSLAKYLMIINHADDRQLSVNDIPGFFRHVLHRANWERDLHFQTRTTIDTLDYSGDALNQGSKLVIAASGNPVYALQETVPDNLELPEHFFRPGIPLAGILAVQGPGYRENDRMLQEFCNGCAGWGLAEKFRLIVIVDDSEFVCRSFDNFLWVVFTRSNPAVDIEGVRSFVDNKHWGCKGPLVIDARIKPHHAPPLIEDPSITRRVDAIAAAGLPVSRYL